MRERFVPEGKGREGERERKVEEMTRIEARKRSLIFPRLLFQFSLSSFCVRMYLCVDNIYTLAALCSSYPGKRSSLRRQFLPFINVRVSAFNVTTRTLYDTDGEPRRDEFVVRGAFSTRQERLRS